MAKKSKINDRDAAYIVFFVIAAIYAFFSKNWGVIRVVLIIIGSLAFILLVTWITLKIIKKNKLRKSYLSSPYYKETLLPYHKSLEDRGVKFEIETYNSIREAIGNDYPMLTNLLIPKMDAINIDSQIDLIVFHSTGIYVIEMKNLSGPLSGKKDDEYWIPYIKNRKKSRSRKFEEEYKPNFALYNQKSKRWVYNPIRQNEEHIRTLNQIIKANYNNIVIFSSSMLTQEYPFTISNIKSVSSFIHELNTKTQRYTIHELKDIYERIKAINHQNRDANLLHIARIKRR